MDRHRYSGIWDSGRGKLLPARHERTKAMTTIDTCEVSKPIGARAVLAATAVATVEKAASMLRAWQNRRELYKLGEMNDRELSDIGLSRSDLFVARDVPATVDPTARLGALAEINRRQSATRVIC